MADVILSSSGQPVAAYLALPTGSGPFPGVVVLHDALGPTDASRQQADWLASSGYLALAPDLFSRGNRFLCLLAVARQMMARGGTAFGDIQVARDWLVARKDCTGRIGIIGFCLGGGFALLMTTKKGFDVASLNYGPVPEDAEALLKGACPIVGSYGREDKMMKGAAARLMSAAKANEVDNDVLEYPGAGHGFLEIHGGKLGWIMTRLGMRFHDASAKDARRRILAFFAKHLSS
jgi:carboxymethylenebutenolidase